jgi:GTP cyclohydrolase I
MSPTAPTSNGKLTNWSATPGHTRSETYQADVRDLLERITPTPMSSLAKIDPEAAKTEIAKRHREIMEILGLDLEDDSLSGTPERVAKMYVDEIFRGLRSEEFPKITVVENKMSYEQMLIEVNITFNSTCEHHFLPIIGKAHVAYLCKGWVLGLSKFNRVVDFFARRPQVQERATVQIHEALKEILRTEDVAVVIDALHCCVKTRGIGDEGTITRTSQLSGNFLSNPSLRSEFFGALPQPADVHLL